MALDYGTLSLSTVGAGILEPSGEEGLSKGAVTFEVVGAGRLSGVSGLLSSNFEFRTDAGTAVEHQVVRLFLPCRPMGRAGLSDHARPARLRPGGTVIVAATERAG